MDPAESGSDLVRAGAQLQRTRPWVRFLSIVGFVWSGLTILGGLAAGAAMLSNSRLQAFVFLFVYPLLGVLYIYPAICLHRYANGIGRFLASPRGDALELALDAQRAFWTFVGILTAISIVVAIGATALAIILGIAVGLAAP